MGVVVSPAVQLREFDKMGLEIALGGSALSRFHVARLRDWCFEFDWRNSRKDAKSPFVNPSTWSRLAIFAHLRQEQGMGLPRHIDRVGDDDALEARNGIPRGIAEQLWNRSHVFISPVGVWTSGEARPSDRQDLPLSWRPFGTSVPVRRAA